MKGSQSINAVIEMTAYCPHLLDIDEGILTAWKSSVVYAGIGRLTPVERAIIALRFGIYDGTRWTYSRISDKVDKNDEAVRIRLMRAIKIIKMYVQGWHGRDSTEFIDYNIKNDVNRFFRNPVKLWESTFDTPKGLRSQDKKNKLTKRAEPARPSQPDCEPSLRQMDYELMEASAKVPRREVEVKVVSKYPGIRANPKLPEMCLQQGETNGV